jgi:hypothetical protein
MASLDIVDAEIPSIVETPNYSASLFLWLAWIGYFAKQ